MCVSYYRQPLELSLFTKSVDQFTTGVRAEYFVHTL